jgi:hypothetical protein
VTEEEREAFWRDIGRPWLEDLVADRRYLAAGDGLDEIAEALNRQQWEYLVQRRMARADVHGGEQ